METQEVKIEEELKVEDKKKEVPRKERQECPRCSRSIEVFFLSDGTDREYVMAGCICGYNVFKRLNKSV